MTILVQIFRFGPNALKFRILTYLCNKELGLLIFLISYKSDTSDDYLSVYKLAPHPTPIDDFGPNFHFGPNALKFRILTYQDVTKNSL